VRSTGPLRVGVADLLHAPGSRRHEHLEAVLGDLSVLGSRVPPGAPVELDVRLESVNEGIVLTGTVRAPWMGECRRCLQPVEASLEARVLEVFEEHPVDGETRPLEVDVVDLEPLARETVLLELPLAPLCREGCAGLCAECGADRNLADCGHTLVAEDGRWSALDQLKFEE
jgi:uncharacterized protein